MIYTVTLNPSIDYIVHLDHLELGAVNRMTNDFKFPGGKGINVSRILSRLGNENTALGFLGGFTGDFIQTKLQQENIITQFTPVKDDTRINVKLKAEEETEINGAGPNISEDEKEALKETLSHLNQDDLVVLAGSVPASLTNGFYEELIQLIRQQGANFVIDTTGKDLMTALQYQPFLVKPNNHELAELFDTTFNTMEDIFPYAQKLLDLGAQNVLISMAGDGALYFNGQHIYFAEPLKAELKNSVGAGDSMIAGFVGAYESTKDGIEAFKMGVACGSATAFSDDLATADFIQDCLQKVTIVQK